MEKSPFRASLEVALDQTHRVFFAKSDLSKYLENAYGRILRLNGIQINPERRVQAEQDAEAMLQFLLLGIHPETILLGIETLPLSPQEKTGARKLAIAYLEAREDARSKGIYLMD